MKQSLLIFSSIFVIATSNAQVDSKRISLGNDDKATCTKLVFKINNGMSRLPSAIVKGLNEARVETNDFSKSDYVLKDFTVTVLYNDSQTFKTSINKGSNFTEQTKSVLNLLKPGDVIVISGVTAINSKKEVINVEERNFGVY